MKLNTRTQGKLAEQSACHFLEKQGLKLIKRNYACLFGEIDLIMQEGNAIVFVEVRSRSRIDYGSASESIQHAKMQKVIHTAMHFLQAEGWLYKVHSRFDVIAIHPIEGRMQLEWIKNAFSGI